MELESILAIRKRLEELQTDWYIANSWKDKRSRHRKIREASVAISNYADTLPPEILGLFDIKVASAALNSQFAGDDIGPCIDVLEEIIKEMKDDDKKRESIN